MGVPEPISIHAPLAGCDILTLLGMNGKKRISIHAPLAGCDLRSAHQDSGTSYFNPRTPCGVRRCSFPCPSRAHTFQSTHPLWGATGLDQIHPLVLQISIHAPLAGCDNRPSIKDQRMPKFQSTHPSRGATTIPERHIAYCRVISIHAPLTGCDLWSLMEGLFRVISIHAPLTGCDPSEDANSTTDKQFQSTHPLRGATSGAGEWLYRQGISIHAPLAGCDHPARCSSRQGHHFNPRTPRGVRPW